VGRKVGRGAHPVSVKVGRGWATERGPACCPCGCPGCARVSLLGRVGGWLGRMHASCSAELAHACMQVMVKCCGPSPCLSLSLFYTSITKVELLFLSR
jgi:hypothetical protein